MSPGTVSAPSCPESLRFRSAPEAKAGGRPESVSRAFVQQPLPGAGQPRMAFSALCLGFVLPFLFSVGHILSVWGNASGTLRPLPPRTPRLPPRASSGSQGGPRGPQGARGQSTGTGWHATARSHGDELDRLGVLHISQEPPPQEPLQGEGEGAGGERRPGSAEAERLEADTPSRWSPWSRRGGREGAQREAAWTGFRPCSLWGRQGPQDDFWAERPSERLLTGDSQREPGGPVSMVRWCCRAKWGGRKGSPGKLTPLYL